MRVTIHNMLQQPAFNPDPPQPCGDVFVKAVERLHPEVVRPPATEIAREGLASGAYLSPAQSSPANMVTSEVEGPVPRATTFGAEPSPRSLSRSLSSPPTQVSKLSSGSKHQTQKVDPNSDMSINANAPVDSSAGLAECGKLETVWSTNDSYLPRAKPPPPLKRIKHRRGHSEELDTPVHDAPIDQSNEPVVRLGCALTRLGTRASNVSQASSVSFAPSRFGSSWRWKPPVSWAGPQPSRSGSMSRRPVGGLLPSSKKNVERSLQGGSDGHTQVPAYLKHVRPLKKLWSVHLTDVGVPEEQVCQTRQGPSGLTVMVQANEDDGWHEREVADVIPMLRELREG